MKPLLVGEDNPYSRDHRYALYPEPEHSAGGRLCRLIMRLSVKDYIRGFDRVNLCAGEWSMREAKDHADCIMTDRIMTNAILSNWTVVLLGAKVTEAFKFDFKPFSSLRYLDRAQIVILPHPSGRNRVWNEPGAFDRARETLEQASVLPLPPWPPKEYPRKATGDLLECLPSTNMTTRRPAWCSNCHLIVRDEHCPECGPQ
jgi:hypothetical protein